MKILSIVDAALKDYEVGNYEEALKKYNTLITDEPECSNHFMHRAQCFTKLGEYSKSMADIREALKLNPNNIEAALTGGRSATKLSKFEDAYNFYKAGLAVDPNHPEIVQDLKMLQQVILEDYDKEGGETEEEQGYKAINLCGQDPYPGDDQMLKNEYEIIERQYGAVKDIPTPAPNKSRSELAAKITMDAHNYMMNAKFKEALEEFSAALDLEPTNKILRRLRAEVFFINEDLVGAIKDLWVIPKGERTADCWKLGGKILMQMKLPVAAEFWLRKACVLSKSQDEEAAVMFQKIRSRRLYDPLTKNFPIFVDFTDYGRGIFALQNISKGDIIFEDEPAVLGLVIDKDKPKVAACDYCTASLLTAEQYFGDKWGSLQDELKAVVNNNWPDVTPVMCDKCKQVTFCSDTCKEKAWDDYHEIICPARCSASKTLHEIADNNGYGVDEDGQVIDLWIGSFSPLVLARMWATIVSTAKKLMKQSDGTEPTQEEWSIARSPFRKFIAYGSGDVVKKMSTIIGLMREIFSDCGDGLKYTITDSEFTGRYYQAACNLQTFGMPITPYHEFLNRLSKHDKEDMKTIQLIKYLEKPPVIPSFCGIFPLHACLNHSCMNNVEVCDSYVNERGGVQVRAKKDIAKGEELFTTYIDTSMPRRLRRAWLYRSFNFWCHCPRCENEGDGPNICTSCKKKSDIGIPFKTCGNCKKAWYCSGDCQKKAWGKGHKTVCKSEHSNTQY